MIPFKPLTLISLVLFAVFNMRATGQDRALIQLGISSPDGTQYDAEFLKKNRMASLYEKNGLAPSLIDLQWFTSHLSEEELYEKMIPFHVIHLTTTNEGMHTLTPEMRKNAKRVGAALARYVENGGGLWIQSQAVRYRGDEDEKYWNLVLEPLGMRILHEGVYDTTRTLEGYTNASAMFWWTQNMAGHPVTEGVKTLYLPLHGFGSFPGLEAIEYSPEWRVLVKGEKEAKSYQCDAENLVDIHTAGTYSSEPPVVAIREMGKGRIVSYPLSPLFSGLNYLNPIWPDIVESAGDKSANRPSDSMKLQMNAYRWLGQPALGIPALGTHRRPSYQPVVYPESLSRDGSKFGDAQPWIRGIIGAHTSYTDGDANVAEYVKAAKDAGLSVIVFTDPLEKLTPESLEKLKADCLAASDDTFYACPGVEFTDGAGIRWVFWGERVIFPDASFVDGGKTYTQWDGSKVHAYGQYSIACGFPGSAIIDYKQMRANGAHPENLWWFFHYFPLAYSEGKLIADNYSEYLLGLSDLRWDAVASFTRIRKASDVASAAEALFTGFHNVAIAKEALNTRASAHGVGAKAGQFMSQGPVIALWEGLATQMESNWRYTRGAQRVRLKFIVRSEEGIADVKVHDANAGVIRRFEGNNAKEVVREFEMVQDKEHWLALEVTDKNGKRAMSQSIFIFSYKQGWFRCGDNLNILGATGLIWHPDRNEMLQIQRPFNNGDDYALRGWDTGTPLAPGPKVYPDEMIRIQGIGEYPHKQNHRAMVGKLLRVPMSSYNISIASMDMTKLSQAFETAERPAPAVGSVPLDMGDHPYFERTHTIYNPQDRLDYYTIWNHRRRLEGSENYQGGLMWNEGEIRFKQDVTLEGAVPIPLFRTRSPVEPEKGWGTTLIVTEVDETKVVMVRDKDKRVTAEGEIRPGGYASWMTALVGYLGFFAPPGSEFVYQFDSTHGLTIGLGHEGQKVKAGTVMRYQFAMGTLIDQEAGSGELERIHKAMNLGGGHEGYPIEMKAGEMEEAVFFFTAKAKNKESVFQLGPQRLPIDLPIRVRGLEDNGCAAVFSTKRNWFRFIPVVGDTAYFQEPIDEANTLWVGNIFVADHKDIKLTVVIDGQDEGKKPFVEVHNPTHKIIRTRIASPQQTPIFGGKHTTVTIPAGDTVRLEIDETLTPMKASLTAQMDIKKK